MKRSVVVLLALLALAPACMGGSDETPRRGAALTDVASVDDLRRVFNEDAGKPRLLVLFAPT